MERTVDAYPLLVRNALAEPRHWTAWAGFLIGYAGLLLGDSLVPRETSRLPAAALLLFASVVPTVWPVTMAPEGSATWASFHERLIGGIGFVLLALPLWAFAVHRVAVGTIASLLVGAGLTVWVWATIASLAPRIGGVAYLALLLGVSSGLFPPDALWRRLFAVLGAPAAYGSPVEVRIAHLLLWSVVGGIGTATIRRRAQRGNIR